MRLQRVAEPVVEGATVGQAGERIVAGEMGNLGAGAGEVGGGVLQPVGQRLQPQRVSQAGGEIGGHAGGQRQADQQGRDGTTADPAERGRQQARRGGGRAGDQQAPFEVGHRQPGFEMQATAQPGLAGRRGRGGAGGGRMPVDQPVAGRGGGVEHGDIEILRPRLAGERPLDQRSGRQDPEHGATQAGQAGFGPDHGRCQHGGDDDEGAAVVGMAEVQPQRRQRGGAAGGAGPPQGCQPARLGDEIEAKDAAQGGVRIDELHREIQGAVRGGDQPAGVVAVADLEIRKPFGAERLFEAGAVGVGDARRPGGLAQVERQRLAHAGGETRELGAADRMVGGGHETLHHTDRGGRVLQRLADVAAVVAGAFGEGGALGASVGADEHRRQQHRAEHADRHRHGDREPAAAAAGVGWQRAAQERGGGRRR
jgi:hypothetical protein